MISTFVVATVLAATVSAATPTPAAGAGDADETLAALVEETLASNPDLAAATEVARAARQAPAQAGSLPDPRLGLRYTNEGWSPSLGEMPDSNLALMVSQDLPFPGKRGL